MARIKAEITRTDNSVFVSVQPPEKFLQVMAAESQPRVWAKLHHKSVLKPLPPNPHPNPY